MIIGGHGIRLRCPGLQGRARFIADRPATPKVPVNDDFDAGTWFVFLAAPRDLGLIPDPVRIGVARNCPKALAKMQHRGRPVLALVARFPTTNRQHAETLRDMFEADVQRHGLGGGWYDLAPDAACGFLRAAALRFIEAYFPRWEEWTDAQRATMRDLWWVGDASATAPAPAATRKRPTPRRRSPASTSASAVSPERARR